MTICKHCGEDTAIRNPSGYCDHLYYPDNCTTCLTMQGTTFRNELTEVPPFGSCKGERFGHNFPYTGAACFGCGISQAELSGQASKKVTPTMANPFARPVAVERKKVQGIHTELQALVDEVRQRFGETATKGRGSFGYYIGFFKKVGTDRVRLFLSEVKDAHTPQKLFWWLMGQYLKEQKALCQTPKSKEKQDVVGIEKTNSTRGN